MKSKIAIGIALVVFLSGCGKSGDTPPEQVKTDLSVLNVSLEGNALTSGELGVFLGSDNGYTARNNVKYTFGNPWSSANPVELGSAIPSLCAYYPYNASLSDATAVPLTSQKYSTAADLCYGRISSETRATTSFSLNLKHAYAQMTLTISRDAGYTGTCAISGVSLSNAGLNASASLNMFTDVYQPATGVVAFNPQISGIDSGKSSTVTALLVPVSTAMSGNLVITLTVDGVPMSTSVDTATSGLSLLQAGKNYQGTLNIQGVSARLNKVSTADWNVLEVSNQVDMRK
nr:fimbrillin family protein [uncultured Bacteroides sp.]